MNTIVLSVTRSNIAFSSLEKIGKRSQTLLEKKKMARFLDKVQDSSEVVTLVEDLRTAIIYYQVSGNRVTQTRVNTRKIALTAAVDVQSYWKTDRKPSHRSRLRP